MQEPPRAGGEGGEGGQGAGSGRRGRARAGQLVVGGHTVEGVSVGGQETCIILPALKLAFDIGRCPRRAVFQDTLLLSHSHIDHIGGLPFYISTRGLLALRPPTVVVPPSVERGAQALVDVFRDLDASEMKHRLLALEVGAEHQLSNSLVVKAFRTYHVIPSQGYCVYSVRHKLRHEFQGLPGQRIKELRQQGTQVTSEVRVPEVAFTGDTTVEFLLDPNNADVLRARLLICEVTFLTEDVSVEHARKFGHTHLSELLEHADLFQNEAILLIHFSARYSREEILERIEAIGPPLRGRVHALTEGF